MPKVEVRGTEITILPVARQEDFICLTDARYKNSDRTDDLIRNWLRNRNTVEFLGVWEEIHNPNFKPVEFDGFRKQAGLMRIEISRLNSRYGFRLSLNYI